MKKIGVILLLVIVASSGTFMLSKSRTFPRRPLIIAGLKEAGCELVTVDELHEFRVSSRAQSRDPLQQHESRSAGRISLDCARDDTEHES